MILLNWYDALKIASKKYYHEKRDKPEPKMIDNETMALFHETAAISKPKQQPIMAYSILTWAR